MAKYMGRLGAVYAANGTTNLAGVTLAQTAGSSDYVLADASVRILRAFAETASIGDFSLSSGTVTGLKKPVGAVTISGGTPPYTLSSSNNKALTLAPVGGFLNWRLDVEQVVADVTPMGAEYREHQRLLRGWAAVAERFWLDENFSLDVGVGMKGIGDGFFVASFFVNTESANLFRYVGFAAVEGLSLDAPVKGIVSERLRFRGHDPLYFRRAGD